MSQDNGRIDSPILESAWQRYAEFKAKSITSTKRQIFLVQATLILALLSVILAVLIDTEIQLHWEEISIYFRTALVIILIINLITLVANGPPEVGVAGEEVAEAL